MARDLLYWIGSNAMPWVLIALMVLAGAVMLAAVAAGLMALFRKSPPKIVLNSGEWTCTHWHEAWESVPPVIIGGFPYPQPKRQVIVADVYVRKGFQEADGVLVSKEADRG